MSESKARVIVRKDNSETSKSGHTLPSAIQRQAALMSNVVEKSTFVKGASRYLRAAKAQETMRRQADYGYSSLAGADMMSGGIAYGSPMWYNPLIGSQDKYYFPAAQERQHVIWRSYYELDPVVGSGTDMYSDLPWSEFSLSGVKDPTILRIYEECLEKLALPLVMPRMTREFIVKGKVIPHLLFSRRLGYWTHCMVHDPSYVGVLGIGIENAPPLLDLYPTPEMQFMAKSADPRLRAFRDKLPPEVLNSVLAGKPIPLSNLNTTYIARKTCMYDVMGTSLYTRLFRVIMYEDALWNAALSVARRNAAPLRVFKLGDPQSGFFPTEADFDSFIQKLSQAELDPAATLVYHFGLDVDYVGVSDKFLKLSDEKDYVLSQKLVALGIPESLLTGEATFSQAESGLQVMIERLAALRTMFEREWIIPKVLKVIAKANGFYRVTPAEVMHNVRVKRPAFSDYDLVVPTLRWQKSLEVRDTYLLDVYKDLMDRGFFSNKSYASLAGGIDLEAEVENLAEDKKLRERAMELLGTNPAEQPRKASQNNKRRVAAIMDGLVSLVQTGRSTHPALRGINRTDTASITRALENEGIPSAESIVQRVSTSVLREQARKAQMVPSWAGGSAQLLSGV